MPKTSTDTAVIMETRPNSPASEAYRSLRFNLDLSVLDYEIQSVTVTSPGRGQGKTTTALNLAFAYAQMGKKVILVDADLRKPSVHDAFGGNNSRGLADFLASQASISELIQTTHLDNLSVLKAGPVPSNPSELLATNRMSSLLAELKQSYDRIIIDTPPVLTLTDAKIMAAQCDGVLLVVEYGKVKRNVAKKVNEELMLAKAKLLGIVMNKTGDRQAEAYG